VSMTGKPRGALLNAPNAITLLRFALVPAILSFLLQRNDRVALILFLISAASDVADGMLARHWNMRTRFGAIADPLADKLTLLAVTISLALRHALPWPFAAAVIVRDALIVCGAVAYHVLIGPVEMAPTRISKLNTALEFLLLVAVLAIQAGLVPDGGWRRALLLVTLATIVVSGGHYVIVWSLKAAQARRGA
jgi:cardiolipin synthase (CMP-forming)